MVQNASGTECPWLSAAAFALLATVPSAARSSELIPPSALAQVEALLEQKRQRTPVQRKLDSTLLYAIARARGDSLVSAIPNLGQGLRRALDGRVEVEIQAADDASLKAQIVALGGDIERDDPGLLQVSIGLDGVEKIAQHSAVRAIRSALGGFTHGMRVPLATAPVTASRASQGSTISQGDAGHAADQARAQYNVDGSGVMVCAISDSVNELSQIQASGELPGNVLVLTGQAGNGTSEGTALLEIIHDLAPGASLGFATAGPNPTVMAQNILGLRAAGCRVIIDDAFFLTEPVFQPGIIAQAIDTVVADGAVYVTAAGNFFNFDAGLSGVFEGLFSATMLPAPLTGAGIAAHDFGGGSATDRITNDGASARFPITLQWANPAGQAADDLDLFLLSPSMLSVVDASTGTQDGDDDALEVLLSAADRTNSHLVVVKFSGNDVYFHLNTNGSLLAIGTDRQSIGHGGSLNQISVGAVGVHTLGAGGVFVGGAQNPPEQFTSDGYRRIFFDASGSPLSARAPQGLGGVLQLTPELLAADRVSTTTTMWQTFFGSSASAPHVAAVAALYLQRFPLAGAAQVKQALINSAVDTGTPGYDRTAGAGILMAPAALAGDFEFADSFEDP